MGEVPPQQPLTITVTHRDRDTSPDQVMTIAPNTRITIGRAADNLITLNHESVSRYNAVISWTEDGQLTLEAFPDAAMLLVNGAVVFGGTAVLSVDSVIQVGAYQLTLATAQAVSSLQTNF